MSNNQHPTVSKQRDSVRESGCYSYTTLGTVGLVGVGFSLPCSRRPHHSLSPYTASRPSVGADRSPAHCSYAQPTLGPGDHGNLTVVSATRRNPPIYPQPPSPPSADPQKHESPAHAGQVRRTHWRSRVSHICIVFHASLLRSANAYSARVQPTRSINNYSSSTSKLIHYCAHYCAT